MRSEGVRPLSSSEETCAVVPTCCWPLVSLSWSPQFRSIAGTKHRSIRAQRGGRGKGCARCQGGLRTGTASHALGTASHAHGTASHAHGGAAGRRRVRFRPDLERWLPRARPEATAEPGRSGGGAEEAAGGGDGGAEGRGGGGGAKKATGGGHGGAEQAAGSGGGAERQGGGGGAKEATAGGLGGAKGRGGGGTEARSWRRPERRGGGRLALHRDRRRRHRLRRVVLPEHVVRLRERRSRGGGALVRVRVRAWVRARARARARVAVALGVVLVPQLLKRLALAGSGGGVKGAGSERGLVGRVSMRSALCLAFWAGGRCLVSTGSGSVSG